MLDTGFPDKRPGRRWWSREDLLLLVLLGAMFFLPGLGMVPLFDRDEPRFATAARTMIELGDYIVPHFNGGLRPDKPPLVYWLMDLGYRAVGGFTEMGARLPSAICGTLTLLVVYFMVGMRFGKQTGLLAAAMLGSCALFVVESRMATADSTMILFIVICMACAWQAWDAGNPESAGLLPRSDYLPDRAKGRGVAPLDLVGPPHVSRISFGQAMVFWISLAAGTMTKGVPLFFVLVPMVVLSLTTGALGGQLKKWRSHFHVTRLRMGIVAGAMGTSSVVWLLPPIPMMWKALYGVIASLVSLMMLTPGLPEVLVRCLMGGNWRWWKGLRPALGIPLLVALVGWWVYLADVQTGGILIHDMVMVHFVARVANPLMKLFGHEILDVNKPGGEDAMKNYGHYYPGFYLITMWATFWPWCILLVPAAFHAVKRVLGKTALAIDRRPYQFLLAWIIPMWICLELSRGKLLHYPLPLFVGLAILCADALVQGWHRLTDVFAAPWFSSARWVVLAIWVGLGGFVLVAAYHFFPGEVFWRCVPFAGALMAAGVGSALAWNRESWPVMTVIGWATALLALNTLVLPALPIVGVGKEVGLAMAEMKKADPTLHFAAQGYEQPTMVFYSGGIVQMPTLDEKGLPSTPVATLPFGPTRKLDANEHYLLVLDQGGMNDLNDRKTKEKITFYLRRVVNEVEIRDLDLVAKKIYIVSNVPAVGIEPEVTRPATTVAAATTTAPATKTATAPATMP